MGLDIWAFKNAVYVEGDYNNETGEFVDSTGEERDDIYPLFDNPSFPGRAEGIKGEYVSYDLSEDLSFRAGSYSSYNYWRNELAFIAGYDAYDDNAITPIGRYDMTVWNNVAAGPFYELINFSDAEGVIGSVVAEKLYNDFVMFKDTAKEKGRYEQFFEKYELWLQAFEYAKENGVVIFH